MEKINKDMTIGSILEEYPTKSARLAEIMTAAGLHCVGCGAALFETLEQGILGHGMSHEIVQQVVAQMNDVLDIEDSEEEEVITEILHSGGNPIFLSEKAVEKLSSLFESEGMTDHGLRVGIIAGGCAGFSYVLNFEKESELDDKLYEQEGIKIFINPESISKLQGTVIDYVETLQESGFKFSNPNSESSCGCGSSFS